MAVISDSAHQASRDVRAVVGRLRRRLREVAADGELTPSQVSVLTRVAKGEAATASALAVLEGVRPQSVASTLSALEAKGLIGRAPDPEDGRARVLELSPRGRQALAAARRFHRRYEQRLARRHGPEAAATLRELLTTLAPTDDKGALDPRLRALQV